MDAYNVMIVDDDPAQSELLESLVAEISRKDSLLIETCSSLAAFEQRLEDGYHPHIVFMDILFGSTEGAEGVVDGIDAARSLLAAHPGVQLVYVTGHAQYCTRVYRTEHIYFLLKPLSRIDLEDALEKAIYNLDERSKRPFGMKVGGRIVRILPNDIEYIESDRRKVRIFCAGGEPLEAYESLAGMSKILPRTFVQCHKSFLVNMERVLEVRGGELLMLSGVVIPVSQKRSRETRDAFMGYLRDRL